MITFNNIVERFRVFADAHFFVKSFSFGSPDDVDLTKFTSFPLMHLVYTGATYDAGTKTYNLEVYILDVPADKDKKTDRQKEVVSDAEQCAEDVIADIKNGGNIFLFAQDYEVVNATTTPLEEETKNVLSGVLLDLSVSIPYEWDACNAPIDGVTPEGGDEVAYARRGILRMLTQNGATDVLSVRTIKVSNGTLTDEGDGVVSLDTAGAESLNELTDVNITSLTPSQLLQYSGISGNWENITIYLSTLADTKGTPAEGKFLQYTGGFWQPVDLDIDLNDLSDVDTSNEDTFKILRYDGTNWIADNVPMVGATGISVLYQNNIATISLDANLADLNNVSTLTPSGNQVLTWSSASGEWQPAALPSPPPTVTELNDLDDVTITTPAANQILRYSGSVWENEDLTQYHDRYQSDAATFRSGATATTEIYYSAIADGDGYAESASSDTPATGYDIRRKLYYSEAGFADPDTGTWVQFATIPDDTTYASAKATLLAYLKARTGGTVPISLKMTWEEVAEAPAFTGLLNETYGSGAAAAFSVRRLNGLYTGSAIQVERSSDNSYQDIGFDVNGDLDESALSTFCTGTTCKVRTWYDQSQTGGSGSGNDAQQTDHTKQPTIYTGGAIVKQDGRVGVDFDGSTNVLVNTTVSITDYDFSIVNVNVHPATTGVPSGLFDSTSNNTWNIHLAAGGTLSSGNRIQSRDGSTTGQQFVWSIEGDRNLNYLNFASASSRDITVNGVQTATNNTNVPFSSLNSFSIGATNDASPANYLDAIVQEVILYGATKSSADQTSVEENIGDYFTQNTPLLDTYTGAAAAYSLRKLRSAFSGSAIRVRRSNDNAETDIGFNVFGELDTVSLAAHCGSNDGFVVTWYDQASTNDATQSTTANQPKIYDGTTGVVTENGKPAVEFDGTNDAFDDVTLSTAVNQNDLGLFAAGRWAAASPAFAAITNLHTSTDDAFGLAYRGDQYTYNDSVLGTHGTNDFTQRLWSGYADNASSDVKFYRDGVQQATTTPVSETHSNFYLGGLGHTVASTRWNGYIHEIMLFSSSTKSDHTNIEDNINTFYSIY